MSVSEELRGFARSASERGDIPVHVEHDLITFANDVADIERERDERHVVTVQEHGRVVSLYLSMLADRNVMTSKLMDENAKLRELVTDMYSHALHPENRPSVSERMRELGIEVYE